MLKSQGPFSVFSSTITNITTVLVAAFVVLPIVLPNVSCTKKSGNSENEILVGEFGSMTGNDATFGQSTSEGIKLAFAEQNERGGVKGKKLRLITLDNQGKSDEARAVVQRLITQDRVVAVLGEVASSRSLAAAPVAQQYKVPLITPSSTNPKVTEIGDFVFRVCFIDSFQGYVMAKFAREEIKKSRVAVLRDVKSDYSTELADVFIREFKKMGGEIVGDESYQAGETDFKAQLTQLRSKKPDAIFVPGYYTEVGLIARQTRQLGMNIPLLGGDGWDSEKLSEIGQSAINGSYFSTHYTTESSEPHVVEFINKYRQTYKGKTPDGLAALGYDAAKVLIAAMERTTEITSQNIRDELAKTVDFPGITGVITIDEHRNAKKRASIVQVDGKTTRFVKAISPEDK
ncbi:MAG: ABC transporter substrate-binding protein [Bdellovibrionales bacterium]|nr:ABC transporter substrate-binding protein [Bdellovibrionales bacterium]